MISKEEQKMWKTLVVVFLVLLILKVAKVVDCSWWIVFSPILIGVGLIVLILLFVAVIAIVAIIADKW